MKVFKLPCEGLMAGSWEGYNSLDATYFVGTQQDHYVFKSRYLIAQAYGKARARRFRNIDRDIDISSKQ
jgi:hypothetical protein